MATDLQPLLQAHPFFDGLSEKDLEYITGCARNEVYPENKTLAQQGAQANYFFLIREGRLAVEIPSPRAGGLIIETLDAGEVAGWSWLFPPYISQFDLRTVTRVRALALDGRCLREKCDAEPRLGLELMKRFSKLMVERLTATRLQLLDMYAANHNHQKTPAIGGEGTTSA